MQTQDVSNDFLIKFWPWFEANRKRLVIATVAVTVVLFVWYFLNTQNAQKAVSAGQAYTQLELTIPPNSTAQQVADAYRKIAADYPGTVAGQRAQLQAAALLFGAARYADAQAVFQEFLGANSGSSLSAGAQLGLAASLAAQSKLDDAATAYRAVIGSYADSPEALPAKFSLAQVLEAQGKFTEATSYFNEVMHSQLGGSLAQEAAEHLAQIQTKTATAKPTVKS